MQRLSEQTASSVFRWQQMSACIVTRITRATQQTPPGVHSTPARVKVEATPLNS